MQALLWKDTFLEKERKHNILHKERKAYECPACGNILKTKYSLKIHGKLHYEIVYEKLKGLHTVRENEYHTLRGYSKSTLNIFCPILTTYLTVDIFTK